MANRVPAALRVIRFMYATLGKIFPERFGNIAYDAWFTPPRFARPERELECYRSADIRTLDVYGLSVHTYVWNDAADRPTILFIHGWSGRGTQVHAFVDPLIAAGYRLVSFDAPAHNESEGRQTSIFQITDTVLKLQQEYGPFHTIITHSFGGMITGFAAHYGLKPGKVAMIAPPAKFETLTENFAHTLALPKVVYDELFRRLYLFYGEVIRLLVDTDRNAAGFDFPGIVVHDRDDPEIHWEAARGIADAWPQCAFLLTEGLKHHRILRDEKVIESVMTFIDS